MANRSPYVRAFLSILDLRHKIWNCGLYACPGSIAWLGLSLLTVLHSILVEKFIVCQFGTSILVYIRCELYAIFNKNIRLIIEREDLQLQGAKSVIKYILLRVSTSHDILQLHILEESIQIREGPAMQSSTFFRNRQLNDVSKNVLRLISNKIYPLNQQKMNRIIKSRTKQKLTKANTEPNEPSSLATTFKSLPRGKATFQEFEQRTMGEHFNQFQTRQLMFSRIQNRQYQIMTQKINDFIWAKRQQITLDQTPKKSASHVELQRQTDKLKKSHSRKNISNIENLLLRLRIKLKEQYRRESQVFQTPICRFSDMEQREKPITNVNFFQQNEGIQRVMQRYPVRESSRVKAKEDPNKKFQRDFLQEIKNSQSNDKYTRMRISINHRKIVSLK